MPVTGKLLAQVAPAVTTSTDLYTCPAATNTKLNTLVIHNNSAAAAVATVNICVAGVASALSNQVFKKSLAADETISWEGIGIVNATDKMRVTTSVANALTFTLSGVEVS